MRRRQFFALVGVAAAAIAAPLDTQAQQAGKIYRIGFLSYASYAAAPAFVEAFRQGLRELGWVEGQNVIIDYRFAEGRLDRLPELAAELVGLKVDIILAPQGPAAVAAKNATAIIPIVMASVTDPVGLGLTASLAHPSRNITGLTYGVGVDTHSKQLELLRETVPQISRVAVLSNPANPAHALAMTNVQVAAQALRVELQLLEARGPDEFDGAFANISKERVGALVVLADAALGLGRTRLADFAARNRLPSMGGLREDAEAGGLMSYGPNVPDLYRRAAAFVDKILKGAKPADLPVEQPTKFELVVNLKTAKAIGIIIPQSILLRTDEVLE
jgi:putative ABC transport system substrate-binding protein